MIEVDNNDQIMSVNSSNLMAFNAFQKFQNKSSIIPLTFDLARGPEVDQYAQDGIIYGNVL